jgi:hypothetical protein
MRSRAYQMRGCLRPCHEDLDQDDRYAALSIPRQRLHCRWTNLLGRRDAKSVCRCMSCGDLPAGRPLNFSPEHRMKNSSSSDSQLVITRRLGASPLSFVTSFARTISTGRLKMRQTARQRGSLAATMAERPAARGKGSNPMIGMKRREFITLLGGEWDRKAETQKWGPIVSRKRFLASQLTGRHQGSGVSAIHYQRETTRFRPTAA